MANAAIYWYPGGGSTLLRKISLGQSLSEVLDRPVRNEVISEAISGRRTKVVFSSMHAVRVRIEFFADESVRRELDAMINQLQRGGTIAVAEDTDYTAWGAYLTNRPIAASQSFIDWDFNLYSGFDTAWTPTAEDILVMQGPGPKYLREEVRIASVAGRRFTISGPRYDYSDEEWVFIRPKAFWPALRLQGGATNDELLTTDNGRITYRLDLPLEEPPDAMATGSTVTAPYQGTSDNGGLTPEYWRNQDRIASGDPVYIGGF